MDIELLLMDDIDRHTVVRTVDTARLPRMKFKIVYETEKYFILASGSQPKWLSEENCIYI